MSNTQHADLFLPYTALQLASAIRALKSRAWTPSKLTILIGAGTTHTLTGRHYTKLLIDQLDLLGIDHCVKKVTVRTIVQEMFRRRILGRFVTGNLRRSLSLVLGVKYENIILLDDGSGTVVEWGYFDRRVSERSVVKKVLTKLSFLPEYGNLVSKVEKHITVFETSIYPSYQTIPFIPASEPPSCLSGSKEISILVTSDFQDLDFDDYVSWIRTRFDLSRNTIISCHPNLPGALSRRLQTALSLELLDSRGLLLEEYVYWASKGGCRVRLMGQENTSTLIVRLFGGVELESVNYPI